MQGLLTGSGATIQAEPSGGAATDEDFNRRTGVDVVAGSGTLRWTKEAAVVFLGLDL